MTAIQQDKPVKAQQKSDKYFHLILRHSPAIPRKKRMLIGPVSTETEARANFFDTVADAARKIATTTKGPEAKEFWNTWLSNWETFRQRKDLDIEIKEVESSYNHKKAVQAETMPVQQAVDNLTTALGVLIRNGAKEPLLNIKEMLKDLG